MNPHLDPVRSALNPHRHHLAQAIDMARNNMAAQFVTELGRPFQIDPAANDPAVERG